MRKFYTNCAYVKGLKKSLAKSFLLSPLLWAVLVVPKWCCALGNHKWPGFAEWEEKSESSTRFILGGYVQGASSHSPAKGKAWDLGFEPILTCRLSPAPSPRVSLGACEPREGSDTGRKTEWIEGRLEGAGPAHPKPSTAHPYIPIFKPATECLERNKPQEWSRLGRAQNHSTWTTGAPANSDINLSMCPSGGLGNTRLKKIRAWCPAHYPLLIRLFDHGCWMNLCFSHYKGICLQLCHATHNAMVEWPMKLYFFILQSHVYKHRSNWHWKTLSWKSNFLLLNHFKFMNRPAALNRVDYTIPLFVAEKSSDGFAWNCCIYKIKTE